MKKKKARPTKKLPIQKNNLDSFVQKPDTPSVLSVTVASNAVPTTPKATKVPTTITPYTVKNIDSSHHVDQTRALLLVVCNGCKNPFSSCYEGKWRRICLHRVLDYIEAKDFEKVTEKAVRKVYYDTFLLMMKADILEETDLYELEEHIHLPLCMKEGSLMEALELMNFDVAYEYMKTVRVHDVQRHVAKRKAVFCGECKQGERIVKRK